MSRPAWLGSFADPEVLADLLEAARSCMAEADECAPELCPHPDNRMTPLEFAEWVELKLQTTRRSPVRLDHAENRKAGQGRRRLLEIVRAG